MALLDWLKAWEIIIGLIGVALGALIWLIGWWDRRSRKYVDQQVEGSTAAGDKIVTRLSAVEQDLRRIDKDLASVVQKLDAMPTAAQYTELKVKLAGIDSSMRNMNGLLTTLYRAAMRADRADD